MIVRDHVLFKLRTASPYPQAIVINYSDTLIITDVFKQLITGDTVSDLPSGRGIKNNLSRDKTWYKYLETLPTIIGEMNKSYMKMRD